MNLNEVYNEVSSLQAATPEAMLEQCLQILEGNGFNEPGAHAHPWSAADVHNQIEERGYTPLTDEQAIKVIERVFANHDCGIGVTYDVIDIRIEELGYANPIDDED